MRSFHVWELLLEQPKRARVSVTTAVGGWGGGTVIQVDEKPGSYSASSGPERAERALLWQLPPGLSALQHFISNKSRATPLAPAPRQQVYIYICELEASVTVLPQPLKFGGRSRNSGGNCSSGPSLLPVNTKRSLCSRFYGHRPGGYHPPVPWRLAPPSSFKTLASVARLRFTVGASASVLSGSSARSVAAKPKQNE